MQPGELIAERFRLDAAIGAGAMGVVFRARDEAAAGRWVAVKVLRQEGSTRAERFLREAGALLSLQHPVLVRYVAHGVTAAQEPYLAMEWIEGPTLAERLASTGLTPVQSVQLGLRVLEGLTALHAAGIVHRDLKPSNLMLDGGDPGAVRILDLGVARFADARTELTQEGSALGTPRYMAPEQVRDARRVDGRADVFALGCVLYECLTGMRAFPGEEPLAVLAQILFGRAAAPSELRPELPEALDTLLSRLLVRSPELRPAAHEPGLRAQLEALLAGAAGRALAALPACRLQPDAIPSGSDSVRALLPELAQAETVDASRVRLSAPPPLVVRAKRTVAELAASALARPLIGRERELRELLTALTAGRPVTLWGGAGVGKTRLAQAAMLEAVARGLVSERGVLFCDLSSARDSRDLVRLCADQLGQSHLGPAEGDVEDQAGRLFGKLGPLLIVLDRAEHLNRELEPLIALWTERAPELRLLVTSRVRLRGTREHALGPLPHRARGASLPGLPGSEAAELPLTAAGELVLALARASWPDALAAPAASVQRQAEDIASALDGNPLAIELALARLPLLGFAGILERLSAQLSLLSEEAGDNTMRKALAWSWQLLGPAQRSAFMQCSVFCAPFSLQAAEAVIALAPGAGAALDVIQSLREQSLLVSRSDAQGQVRLGMPAVVRELAREELARASASDASLAAVAERHAQQVLAQAAVGGAELDDVVAAAEHSLGGASPEPARALSLVLAIERPLLAAGSGSRFVQLLERALAALERALPAADEPVRAERTLLRGYLLRARLFTPAGERERAQRDLEHVLARAQQLGEHALWATAQLDLGVCHHFARELERAEQAYQRALDALMDLDDPVAEARCLGNLGAVQHDRAQLTAAADGYRRALALLPEHGQERLLANFKGNLALVEHELGAVHSARQLYGEAAALLSQLLDARLLGIVLGNLGTLELGSGQLDAALACFTRAAQLLVQGGDRRSEGLCLARLAAALAQAGHVPEAEQRHARAERLLRRDPIGRAVAELLSGFIDLQLAAAATHQGQAALAQARLAAAQGKCLGARALRAESDDLRLFLAILEPRLDALRAAAHGAKS